MIDMNEKLMVDRDCFERGCMSIPHTHVRAIKDDEVVWMVKEQPEPTRWKPWVELTDEDIENCFDESCHLKVVDPKGGIKGSVNIFEVGRAIVQLCKERNT